MKDNGENGVANFSCGGELFTVTAGNLLVERFLAMFHWNVAASYDWLNNTST